MIHPRRLLALAALAALAAASSARSFSFPNPDGVYVGTTEQHAGDGKALPMRIAVTGTGRSVSFKVTLKLVCQDASGTLSTRFEVVSIKPRAVRNGANAVYHHFQFYFPVAVAGLTGTGQFSGALGYRYGTKRFSGVGYVRVRLTGGGTACGTSSNVGWRVTRKSSHVR